MGCADQCAHGDQRHGPYHLHCDFERSDHQRRGPKQPQELKHIGEASSSNNLRRLRNRSTKAPRLRLGRSSRSNQPGQRASLARTYLRSVGIDRTRSYCVLPYSGRLFLCQPKWRKPLTSRRFIGSFADKNKRRTTGPHDFAVRVRCSRLQHHPRLPQPVPRQ